MDAGLPAGGGGVPVPLCLGDFLPAFGGVRVLWGHQAPVLRGPHLVDVLLGHLLPGGPALRVHPPGGGG